MDEITPGSRWLDSVKTVNNPDWCRVATVEQVEDGVVVLVGRWEVRDAGVWAPTEGGKRIKERLPVAEFLERFVAIEP